MSETSCPVHKLVAEVCVTAERHVLLVRYRDLARYHGARAWFVPDDFLAQGEHPFAPPGGCSANR